MTDPERWLDDPALPKQLRSALTERVRATELPSAVRRRVGVRLAAATGAVLAGSVLTGQAAASGATSMGTGANGAVINAGAGVGKVSAVKLAIAAKVQGLGGAAGWVTSSVIVAAIGAAVLVDQVTTEVPRRPESSSSARAGENTTMRSKQVAGVHPEMSVTAPSEETSAAPETQRDVPEPGTGDAHAEHALPDARPWPVQGGGESAVTSEINVEPAARRDDDALVREVNKLRAASRALDIAPQEALDLVQRHRREFPRSQLATERRVLELRALLALGRTGSAKRIGLALLEEPRAALYHERVRRLLAGKGEKTQKANQ